MSEALYAISVERQSDIDHGLHVAASKLNEDIGDSLGVIQFCDDNQEEIPQNIRLVIDRAISTYDGVSSGEPSIRSVDGQAIECGLDMGLLFAYQAIYFANQPRLHQRFQESLDITTKQDGQNLAAHMLRAGSSDFAGKIKRVLSPAALDQGLSRNFAFKENKLYFGALAYVCNIIYTEVTNSAQQQDQPMTNMARNMMMRQLKRIERNTPPERDSQIELPFGE
ncbi:MAG: hypothetical protein ABIQ89_02085 [Candidatus Saccharimonadales bacterium]